MRRGKTVTSRQTGFPIELPATPVGRLQVVETFGDSVTNEGSVAAVTEGRIRGPDLANLFVVDAAGVQ